jgi:hypothetical protein
MEAAAKEKELRISLAPEATDAFEAMIERLKAEMPAVKIQPSQFVSFLVADYFGAHFEKDKAVLIAEFFDSDAFHEMERKKAKGQENYEELMALAIKQARKIKSKKRRKVVRKGRQTGKENEALTT